MASEHMRRTSDLTSILLTLGCVCVGGMVLYIAFGGVPPRSWRLLLETLPHISLLWKMHGMSILPTFGLLILQCLSLLLAWGALLFIVGGMIIPSNLNKRTSSGAVLNKYTKVPAAPTPISTSVTRSTAVQEYASIPTRVEIDHKSKKLAGPFWYEDEEQQSIDISLPTLTLNVGARIDTGIAKKHMLNEDRLFLQQWSHLRNEPCGLFIIADGEGIAMRGQEASRLVVQTLSDALIPSIIENVEKEHIVHQLVEGIQNVNTDIYYRNYQKDAPISATVNALLVIHMTAYIVQVGQCRSYLYREQDGILHVLNTSPDNSVNKKTGFIPIGSYLDFTENSQKSEVLGNTSFIDVELFTVPLQAGDILLLCSDGLWNMVADQDIQHILSHQDFDPVQATQQLLEEALQSGGSDNVSMIALHITQEMLDYQPKSQDVW